MPSDVIVGIPESAEYLPEDTFDLTLDGETVEADIAFHPGQTLGGALFDTDHALFGQTLFGEAALVAGWYDGDGWAGRLFRPCQYVERTLTDVGPGMHTVGVTVADGFGNSNAASFDQWLCTTPATPTNVAIVGGGDPAVTFTRSVSFD